jgi:hypothetical protein
MTGTRAPLALATAGLALLAGCAPVDAALSAQQATVSFKPGTTTATIAAVGRACSGLPGLPPAPFRAVPGRPAPAGLRFDASHATGADLARLQSCLMKFPLAVSGVSVKDTGSVG